MSITAGYKCGVKRRNRRDRGLTSAKRVASAFGRCLQAKGSSVSVVSRHSDGELLPLGGIWFDLERRKWGGGGGDEVVTPTSLPGKSPEDEAVVTKLVI